MDNTKVLILMSILLIGGLILIKPKPTPPIPPEEKIELKNFILT